MAEVWASGDCWSPIAMAEVLAERRLFALDSGAAAIIMVSAAALSSSGSPRGLLRREAGDALTLLAAPAGSWRRPPRTAPADNS